MVGIVTGQPFEQYLQTRIFAPLGMRYTGRLSADSAAATPQAPPVERVFGIMWKSNVRVPLYGARRVGGGSLRSTVDDLARFLIAHGNEGRYHDVRILGPDTARLMHAPHHLVSVDMGMVSSGYGWTRYQEDSWQFWGAPLAYFGAQGHGGSDVGYRSRVWYVEEDSGGYGIVLLINAADFLKRDMLWFMSAYRLIEDQLLREARSRFRARSRQTSDGQPTAFRCTTRNGG
jgi:CubicO group peptidase (beta-lactamase class C family)